MSHKTNTKLLVSLFVVIIMTLPATSNLSDGENDLFELKTVAEHGAIIDVSTGLPFESGKDVFGTVELLFVPNSGHEFITWNIEGVCETVENGISLKLSSFGSNVEVTAITRNYSTSQELITVVDSYGTPVPGDKLTNAWTFVSTELYREGMLWKGMPCTPLIVGEKVYVRAAGILYALDVHSGTILKQVKSGGEVSYYHYISYGNGVIFDTTGHKAYDLDLNYLYDIPSTLVYASYHQGFFYGCLSTGTEYYTLFKTSIDPNTDIRNGVKINLFEGKDQYRVFAQYGQFSNVIFENGYFFFLQAIRHVGTSGWRAMTAVNLENEKSYTVELTGFTGMPWDDGWLSYYNGYFYLTAYTAGLFDGVIHGLENKRSSVMWAKFDFETGVFEEPQYEEIKTPEGSTFRGIASGLEIFNGRGYINVRALGTDTLGGSDDTGTCLIAFDIADDGRPVPRGKASSPMTHGGIVINTAYNEEGKRYIYILPYNQGGQGLYVFTDELVNGTWTLHEKFAYMPFNKSMNEYCSQAVRMGPNGELIFYLDSGYIQCYIASERYPFTITTINNGTAHIDRIENQDLAGALEKLYPGSEVEGDKLTIGTTAYRIYGLNETEWAYEPISDLSITNRYSGTETNGTISAPYSQIALVEIDQEPHFFVNNDEGWYFVGDSGVEKCNLRSRESLNNAIGCTLVYSETEMTSNSFFMRSYLTVMRNSTVFLELPSQFESTFSVDGDSIIRVERTDNTLAITGLTENTAMLTLDVGGRTNCIKIDVLPKTIVIDGKTVTQSERTRNTDDGTITTVYTKTDDGTVTTTVSTETEKDSSGNTIRIKEVNEEKNLKGITSDGQLGTVTTRDEKITESGTITSHRTYESESRTETLDGIVTRTTAYDAVRDNLTMIKVVTKTVSTNYRTFVESESTSVTYDGDEKELSSESDRKYTSKTDSVDIDRSENSLTVTVNDGSADITEVLDKTSEDTTLSSVSVNTGPTLNGNSVDAARRVGAKISLNTSDAKIVLDRDALNGLTGEGDLSFSVTDGTDLTPKQRSSAGSAKVFSITLKHGNEDQHGFGTFTMTLSCDIETEAGKDLRVWRIDNDGTKTYANNVSYSDGKVSFTSDHLSVYAIGYETDPTEEDPSDNSMIYIAIATIVILALLMVAIWKLRNPHKS